jgi:hypothetical protein
VWLVAPITLRRCFIVQAPIRATRAFSARAGRTAMPAIASYNGNPATVGAISRFRRPDRSGANARMRLHCSKRCMITPITKTARLAQGACAATAGPCRRRRSELAHDAPAQLSAHAALCWRKSAMLYRSTQKPLIVAAISKRVTAGGASGGQAGVGPKKLQAKKLPGDCFRGGLDRGDASPCLACLWRDSARGNSRGCVHRDSDRRARDAVLSEGVTTAIVLRKSKALRIRR